MGTAEKDRQLVVAPYTLTAERIAASLAAVVGPIGMALGAVALACERRVG